MKLRHLALYAAAATGFVPVFACPPSDDWRTLVCTGPIERIPDEDPALELFREAEPDSLEARKVALAIARVNACD